MKTKENGVTLIVLVMTIIILLILATIGVTVGTSTLDTAGFTQFRSELKIMQDKVNELNQDNRTDFEKENGLTDEQKSILNKKEISDIIFKDKDKDKDDDEKRKIQNGFKYFNKENIKDELGLDSVKRNYFINVEYRYVIFPDGYEYDGTKYYMIDQIDGEIYNVRYKDKNVNKTGTFDVTVTSENNRCKVEISNIVYGGYVDKWQVKYKQESDSYWETSNDLTFFVKREGMYTIKVVHDDEIDLGEQKVEILYDGLISDKFKNGVVKVGDYVSYNATDNYSYVSPKGTGITHGNGSSDQTFKSSSDMKWRVLGKDTSTGEIILISETPIGNLTMNGAVGYLYAEQELNEICKIYGYGEGANKSKIFNYITGDLVEGTTIGTITESGARSISIDDINKLIGYAPSNESGFNYGDIYTHSIYYPTVTTETGYSTSTENRSDQNTFYVYNGVDYLKNTEELYKILFRNMEDSGDIIYWLASRGVFNESSYVRTVFGIRYIKEGGVQCDFLSDSREDQYFEAPVSKSIRPIVYLKSTVKTNGKDSNGAWNIVDN